MKTAGRWVVKISKCERRDKKREKRRHGMRVDGESVKLIAQVIEKRDKKLRGEA